MPNNALEELAECIALTKAAMSVLGEAGVMGSRLPIRGGRTSGMLGEMHLFTQTAFRTDAKAVTDDQHTNHQLGINGGPPRMAVIISKMFTQITKVRKPVDATQQMIGWNVVFEVESIEKAALAA